MKEKIIVTFGMAATLMNVAFRVASAAADSAGSSEIG